MFPKPKQSHQFTISRILGSICLMGLVAIGIFWKNFAAEQPHSTTRIQTRHEKPRSAMPAVQAPSDVVGQETAAASVVTATPEVPNDANQVALPDFTKIEDFQQWSKRWSQANAAERAALTEEGIALAGARRPEFKALIINDPERALAEAVSRVIRQDLPVAIQELLEQPVSIKGELYVYFSKAAPGVQIPAADSVVRSFEASGIRYQPHFFGKLANITSKKGVPLRGVAIDRDLAVAENAVRLLELGERIKPGTIVEQTCPISKLTTATIAEGETVTEKTPLVEIDEKIVKLCEPSHVEDLQKIYRDYIQGKGMGGGGYFNDNYPGTGSNSIGHFRCLYIRATYPDQQIEPITEERAYADMRDNARFYLENSYGKLTQTTTVTPLVTLPHTLTWYKTNQQSSDGLYWVHFDSAAAALALGYDATKFDCVIVRINDGPLLAGVSRGGGGRVWITWDGMDVINHEVGHSFGLHHANSWISADGTPYGYGNGKEYGNIFDVMGDGYGFSAHYNTVSKRQLGWLPDSAIHFAKNNGTYRIYAYDQPTLEVGKRYGLNVAKDSIRQYNLEYHPARGGRLADSALAIYSGMGSNAGHLLDTTQASPGGMNDGGIAVGRTFSDREADMHFTVLGVNATTPPSLDITFNRGPFPDNVAPVANLTSTATTIAVGGSVTFTAAASDANGDALAYRWECSDGVSGSNSATYTRSFSNAAQMTVMLTVSDMKGGTVQCSVVVGVGNHGKQTVTGTVTASGLPLSGVYLSNGSESCFSNTDGTYALAGLNSDSQTLTAVLNGYTLTPSFINPFNVVVGTNTANWTAIGTTAVTLTKVTDAVEGGVSGSFRLTRSGSTSAALVVLVSPAGGTAVKNTDYTFTSDYVDSGSFKSFTIPAGVATLDIAVAAVNDTNQEGPETITLQLAGGASYLANRNSAVIMTVVDNDTSLPLVNVTVLDPYAAESPSGDTGTFRFSRVGSTTTPLNLTVAWSGLANNGVDYATLPTTITIPAGQNFVNLTLTPSDDSLIEIPEDAVITISANSGLYLVDSSSNVGTVMVTDDDTPIVTVSVQDAVASETGLNSGVFLVTRSGNTSQPLKVYYGLSGGALHGNDYAPLNGEVIIPAGAKNAPIVITPYDDDLAEATETITLAIANFNDTYSIGIPSQGSLDLLDNGDSPQVSVRPGTVGIEGGDNPTFIFHTIGSGSGMITVNYTLSGTATSGSDYTVLSGTISVPANGSSDTTLSLLLLDDSLAEAAETIVLKITPLPSYRVYNEGSAEDVIVDNDSPSERVMISTINRSPAEGGGETNLFYISRNGNAGSLDVNYSISGTATNGIDYQALSGSIVIPDGQFGVNLVMTPIDDTNVEGTETVTLTILPGTGYGPDRPSNATYEITDNEIAAITVGFQQYELVTSEKPGILGEYRDIPVVLSATSTNTIRVDVTCAGGNSTGDDVDWAFVDAANGNTPITSGTLTFLPGVTSQNLRIRIKNDNVIEGLETTLLKLRNPRNTSFTTGRDLLKVTIFDDLLPTQITEERWNGGSVYNNNTWSQTPANYTGYLSSFATPLNVGENYSRRLTGQIIAPSTGIYTFWIASDDNSRLYLSTNSTAGAKVQIANLEGNVNFQNWYANPTQRSAAISLVAGQSYYMEVQHQEGGGGDHVSVGWQGPGFGLIPVSNAIPDTAPRTIRMLTATSTRIEVDGSEPLLQVLLDRAAGSTPITVNYSTSGTAVNGLNYRLPPGTLTFAAGEQMKAIPLILLASSSPEVTKTIIITLSAPSGASLSSPPTHTIQLIDSAVPIVNTVIGTASSSQAINSVVATATVSDGQPITRWSIISGNTGNVFGINASGQIILLRPTALLVSETIQISIRALGSSGIWGDGLVNIVCNPGAQAVTEQRWNGDSAFLNQSWNGAPSYSGTLATFTTPQNVGNDYSRRLTSFLKVKTSGDYTFWIAGDDDCKLYLSTDATEANKALIARVDGYIDFQKWDTNPSQRSVTIPLVAGSFYWFEAQQRDGSGGDHVSVAWSGPGISQVEIPSSALFVTTSGLNFEGPTPVVTNTAPTLSPLSNLTLNEDAVSGLIALTVGDAETAAASLLISASSSNSSLIPNSSITLAGSGANRTFTLTPASNQNGSAVISLTVDDGITSTTGTFVLIVTAVAELVSPVTSGLVLCMDASKIKGTANGAQLDTWADSSGAANNAIRQSGSSAGYPMYVASAINNKPVVRFSSSDLVGDGFKFTRISTIRTVFWVLKEKAGLGDGRFLLGDDTAYEFHRKSANGPLWDDYAHSNIKNGTTRLMGNAINGTTTSLPSESFQVVSLVTAGNVRANQICQDRMAHGSWQGDIAEILIYDRALTVAEELQVGSYLSNKYALSTAYPVINPLAVPTVVSAAPAAPGAVRVSWLGESGAMSFNISYKTGVGGTEQVVAGVLASPYTISGLTKGISYDFKVAATYPSGTSAYSGIVSATPTGSSTKEILTFSFPGQPAATFSDTQISVFVPIETTITALAPTYTVSANATGSPLSGTPRNFTTPQTYTITAEDGSTKVFTVTVFPEFIPPITNGLVLRMDASKIKGAANGTQLDIWADSSSASNKAIRQSGSSAGYPMYVTDALNNKPVVRFNSSDLVGDGFKFTRISTIRTVFWVLKEKAGLGDGSFLLGDDTAYNFHRKSANGPLWDSTYSDNNVKNGITKLMGNVINGTTTPLPAGSFQVVSLVTTGNVRANQICQDRTSHGSWQGDIAEILIYDRALTGEEELQVGSYLSNKYALSTAYPVINPPAAPSGLLATAVSSDAISLSWPAVFGASSYKISYKPSVGGTDQVITGVSASPYIVSGLDHGISYDFKVAASNAIGTSAYSNIITATSLRSPAKEILTFVFPGRPNAIISGTNISITLPFGSSLSALAPTYTVSAYASGSPISGTTLNFATAQTYTITAANGNIQTYTVTVTLAPPPLIYDFNDATLQGWRNRVWNGSTWVNLAANATTYAGTLLPASSDNGLFVPGNGAVWANGNVDNHLNTLWLRSPQFYLNGTGDLTVQLAKGVANTTAPANDLVIPFTAISGGGWKGVALRRVSDGVFVLNKPRNVGNDDTFRTVTFTKAELATLDFNVAYTLELINSDRGGWGWLAMDNVSIPGTAIVGPITTTTTVASNSNPSKVEVAVILTSTVSGDSPTGIVSFYDGAALLGTSVLNGSLQASHTTSGLAVGTHNITAVYAGNTTNSASTSKIFSQVVSLPGYQTWANTGAHGLTSGVNDAPLADPDGDGVTNLMEFVLGGAPMASSQTILPALAKSSGNWVFEYNRSDSSLSPATIQIVEYGNNLSGWTPVTIPTTSSGTVEITPGNPSDRVKVTVPSAGSQIFFRLKVSQ